MRATRRNFIGGMAAVSVVPATGAVAASALDVSPILPASSAMVPENPDLLRAHDELLAARSELAAAKDALKWLVDEWRHLWPLAPEELLGCANANWSGDSDDAERDIAGHLMMRDTSVLTKRLSAKFRAKNAEMCFSILSSDEVMETITEWQKRIPRGRTEQALARNRAYRDRVINEYEHKLVLAREYEAETTRLRDASGVDRAKQRINNADLSVIMACGKVSRIPAFTLDGLMIKAEALKESRVFTSALECNGTLGDMARFIEAVIDMGGRA